METKVYFVYRQNNNVLLLHDKYNESFLFMLITVDKQPNERLPSVQALVYTEITFPLYNI